MKIVIEGFNCPVDTPDDEAGEPVEVQVFEGSQEVVEMEMVKFASRFVWVRGKEEKVLNIYCDDGAWTVTHQDAPGISGFGETEYEALRNFSTALLEWIQKK